MCVCFDVHIVSNLVGRVVGGVGKMLMEVDLFITAFLLRGMQLLHHSP
jgi:hypothetical protein